MKALACAVLVVVVAASAATGSALARSLRLGDRVITVAASPNGERLLRLAVTVADTSRRPIVVRASDFAVAAEGDIFPARGARPTRIGAHRSALLHLTFALPRAARERASLFYRGTRLGHGGTIPLNQVSRGGALSAAITSRTFWATAGVGDPWGTAVDGAGNVWFAEPGCDFAPTCSASARTGQIGELKASSHAIVFYTLPNIPGNQPIFLTFDNAGNLWFTTPNNSMIGEFNPATGQFVGQWPVTAGSGPWDLTFAGGRLWYTEHLAAAVGSFDPTTHVSQDFQTPTANSNPYGIAASGSLIWFTENNSGVDRIASLDTANGNAISEYPIVRPLSGTPHLVTIDGSGHPWWSEGWSNSIATLDPATATPGQCGVVSGPCVGVQRFKAPPATSCSTSGTHTSGIAFQGGSNLVWLDNSLTAQVGSFNPADGTFALTTLSNCSAHPHDGLNLDPVGNVWFDEEFANAIGEFVTPAPPPPPPPSSTPSITGFSPSSGTAGTTVTISGANLTGATGVVFNGTVAAYSVDSASQVTATVPAGATSGPISVTTPGGTAASSASFTVAAASGATAASDSFNRTVSGGWGSADTGGPWTILDSPASWNVSPGAGSVQAGPGAQDRAVLGGVAVRDVDLLAELALPLCTGGSNCDSFLLGRYTAGASPTYYRVGAVQGQHSTVYLRVQRDDGTFLTGDVDAGIPVANGVLLWMRVEFQGVNPTTIRARVWPAGTTEPSTWLVSTTDANAAEQAAGAVGVRARNEDGVAHTFQFQSFQASPLQ